MCVLMLDAEFGLWLGMKIELIIEPMFDLRRVPTLEPRLLLGLGLWLGLRIQLGDACSDAWASSLARSED